MKLLFKGLIAFVTYDEPDKPKRFVAVLMNHPGHLAQLRVLTSEVIPDETSLPGTTSNVLSCYALGGRVITSEGSNLPTADNSCEVPRTREGFPEGMTLHESFRKGAPNRNRFSAVFELPPDGTLDVADCAEHKGTFDGTKFKCIPNLLVYKFQVSDPVTFYIGSKSVVIKPDASVWITNMDPSEANDPKHDHYEGYRKLFNERITVVHDPLRPDAPRCKEAKHLNAPDCGAISPRSLDVDCSPVRFP